MQLEFDADEQQVIDEFRRAISGSLSEDRFQERSQPPHAWDAMVAGGWADIGAHIDSGLMDIGVAVGLFKVAGAHLQIEQFVTSGFLLSSLATCVCDSMARKELRARLMRCPGVLVGDGRRAVLPDPGDAVWHVFGLEETADLYRITRDESGIPKRLGVHVADPPEVFPTARLSNAAGSIVACDQHWIDHNLDVDQNRVSRLERNAVLLHTAALLGCAERLLYLTRDYTLARTQFGVPIASFQSVKHGLADVFVAIEIAWSSVLSSAADDANDDDRVSIARLLTVEAALSSARSAAQFHGGIGFTKEHNLHNFLKAVIDGCWRFGAPQAFAHALGRSFTHAHTP